ncbi:hypothetical protein GCM10023187_05260 [Nibrella viscosa]|uniref:Uncharacterized protein n=1 Tax=Nibrella viscosa TaxID=1084524 RepID=A0ABP8JVF9_9BACT
MYIEKIIRELLTFVRVRDGELEVAIAPNQWISLSSWCSANSEFSLFRLESGDTVEDINKLKEYFYQTFYVLGRSDLTPVADQPSSPGPPLRTYSLKKRPEQNKVAYLKNPEKLTTGEALVEQNTDRFTVAPGSYLDNKLSKDKTILLFNHIPRTNIPEDHYVFSDSIQPGFAFENQFIRFYFHPYPDLAESVTNLLITHLDAVNVHFLIKYLPSNKDPNRCDRIILYLPQRQFVTGSWTILQIYPFIRDHLIDRLPLFTKKILSGIGFAEDPVVDESFGEMRCSWLAEVIIAWALTLPSGTTGIPPADLLIDALKKAQKINDLETIHLTPGSFYQYDFNLFSGNDLVRPKSAFTSFWLQGAIEVADFLCREVAVLTAQKSVWIGAKPNNQDIPEYEQLKKDWERGFIGPALFLFVLNKYIDNPFYHYIIERTAPNLKATLSDTEPLLCTQLLAVYNYPNKHPILSMLHRYILYLLNLIRNKKMPCIAPEHVEAALHINGLPPGDGMYVYRCLCLIMTETVRRPRWRPKKLYQTLKQIQEKKNVFEINERGWQDLMPGMNGLALVGFSFLLAHDPLLPPVPIGNLDKELK